MLPKGLCLSPLGFLAVVDSGNACVRKVSLDGTFMTPFCLHPYLCTLYWVIHACQHWDIYKCPKDEMVR